MADKVANMVAGMVVDKVADKVADRVADQTSYLSKDLRDRNFGPQKFTQKKGNLR